MVSDLVVDAKAMKKAAGAEFSTATDLADWLVQNLEIPFREAHHITGAIVALAEKKVSISRGCRFPTCKAPNPGSPRTCSGFWTRPLGEEPDELWRDGPFNVGARPSAG